jgi:hypothetical protein
MIWSPGYSYVTILPRFVTLIHIAEAGFHWIRRISGLGYSQQQLESRQDL